MLIPFRKIVPSVIFSAAFLLAGKTSGADWNKVEKAERENRLEAERRVITEAERLRKAEAENWKKSAVGKTDDQNVGNGRGDAAAEIASARARAEAAERARDNAEKALKDTRDAEKAQQARRDADREMLKAMIASEQARARAAEKARNDAEKARVRAEAALRRARAEIAGNSEAAERRKAAVPAPVREDSSGAKESLGVRAGRALLWYIPNRLSDLMDIFTAEIGVGELGLDLQLTRHAAFGAGVGRSYMVGWSIFNQHGVYRQQGWYADVFRYRASNIQRDSVCGAYTPFFKTNSNLVDISEMRSVGAEDPWAVGIKACCYVDLKFQFHVTEFADFLAGFLFIDFMDDDKPQFNWVLGGI